MKKKDLLSTKLCVKKSIWTQVLFLLLSAVIVFLTLLLVTGCSDNGSGKESTTDTEFSTQSETETEPETEKVEKELDYYAYLFVYFTGNNPSQERVFYAVSENGYDFTTLNGGKPVLTSKSGTKCVRDPYVFRGQDGYFYMIATDMQSSLGWNSNRNLISWRSADLVKWEDETVIRVANTCKTTRGADRVWAPQAIWNEERGEYMIYFALHSNVTGGATIMYYAYSIDMKTFTTEPALLYAPKGGKSAIDADIIYQDGLYYMYFKDESSGGIRVTTSERMDGGYSLDSILVSRPGLAVEGSSIYKLFNSNGWLLISDAYTSGYFTMQYTEDLIHFVELDRNMGEYSFNFKPRHGSVLPITRDEYDALLEAYPIKK